MDVDPGLMSRIVVAANGRPIATAESCTAGRLSTAFVAEPGASAWFRGGVVAYQAQVKRELLQVSAPSVISEQAAAEMALGVSRLLSAEVTIATTGVTRAPSQGRVDPGTVFVATLVGSTIRTHTFRFTGFADAIADQATAAALHQLADHLRGR